MNDPLSLPAPYLSLSLCVSSVRMLSGLLAGFIHMFRYSVFISVITPLTLSIFAQKFHRISNRYSYIVNIKHISENLWTVCENRYWYSTVQVHTVL